MQTILYIDHSESYRLLLQEELSEEGYRVATAESIEEALSKLKSLTPDLIILEFRQQRLKEKSLENLKKYYPDIPCIGHSTFTQCPGEYKRWVDYYLPKLPYMEDMKKLIKDLTNKK
jgi:DNA-binding NtrC family response regulator